MRQSPLVFGVTVLTMGILSVTPGICANQASQVDANSKATPDPFAPDSRVFLSLPVQGSEDLTYGAVTESPGETSDRSVPDDRDLSSSELNRELTNPVSSLWSISNQFNNFELNNGQWNNNWNFQPVLPVSLTKDWNLITRPVMPFYNIVPHETAPGEFARDAGLGDLALVELLSPAHSATGFWEPGLPPSSRLRPRFSPARASGSSDPVSWQATSRNNSSLACSPNSGGPSAASTASPTRTR
jgi:hypothetical protein